LRVFPKDDIRIALAARPPLIVDDPTRPRAAVAVVLRDGEARGAEVLLIERARHEGDPWSGHMAFPGGRVEPVDPDSRAAAKARTLPASEHSSVSASAEYPSCFARWTSSAADSPSALMVRAAAR